MVTKTAQKTLELIFDFGSPNAYLSMKALPELLDRTGADLLITPCLLGGIFKATGNKAPMIQYADAPAKLAYENLEMRRFIERHGLAKFRINPHFPVNTLLAMRGAIGLAKMAFMTSRTDSSLTLGRSAVAGTPRARARRRFAA